MEMSLEDLRDYVIYQMIEDENKYDPNYDDEEFFLIGKRKSSLTAFFHIFKIFSTYFILLPVL